jgi:photosystem II stability/assembly factor-like uncharacterized protein
MKKNLILITIIAVMFISKSFAQQYGWIDISNNLPSSGGTITLPDMYWINDNEGWICSGLVGEIYHTTNGGSTYTTQTTQYSTYAIHMLNSSEGYAGGLNGRVYRTTDGGGTWNVLGSIGGTLLSISFPPSSTTGYCCGYTGRIYSITSSGVSSMSSGVSSNLKSISFPGSQGWTCGEQVMLHYNTSWIGDQSYPDERYNGIYMINNTTGWAIGDYGVIIHTTDGINWNYQANPDTLNRTLNNVFFLNASEGWAVGDSGVILHTTNGGTLWTIEASGMTTNMLTSVQFTSSTNGYVLGNNKTLFKFGLITDVNEQPSKPNKFMLEQNYPNPFNSETKISYTLAIPAQVKLTVCNIFGQQVALLDEGFKPAGSFSAEFTGVSLPSGIYYYRLQCGDRHETRKMTLIK